MFDFPMPYLDMYLSGHRRRVRKKPTKICQQTCPDCGKKNVNIYLVSQLDKYICKKCVDNYFEGGKK